MKMEMFASLSSLKSEASFSDVTCTALRRLAGNITSGKVMLTSVQVDLSSPPEFKGGKVEKPAMVSGTFTMEFTCPRVIYAKIFKAK